MQTNSANINDYDTFEPITYKKGVSKNEAMKFMKAVGLPLAVFCFSMFVISALGQIFYIAYAIAAMWLTGTVTAAYLSQMREEVLDQTCKFIIFYGGGMIAFKLMIKLTAGVSAEMLSATLELAIPTATGNILPSYITNMMLMSSVLTPIGFIIMQGRRIMQFRRTRSINKEFGRARGFRNTGRPHDRI